MARAHAVLSGAPPVGSFAIALATLVLVGGIDYVLGYEISFSLFYLLPVGIATWYCGRGAGMAMAVLSCAVWFSADLLSHPPYSHQAIPVWNALGRRSPTTSPSRAGEAPPSRWPISTSTTSSP